MRKVVANNLRLFFQDPFVAQPSIGPKWTWDHDGDGLGDGNGNGLDDWACMHGGVDLENEKEDVYKQPVQ